MNLTLIAVFVLLSHFCAFGFVASYEPGDHFAIRVLYLSFSLGFLALALWRVLRQEPATRRRVAYGLAGAAASALAALVLITAMTFMSPRGSGLSLFQGLRYGICFVPITSVTGARLGLLLCR